MRRDRHRDTWRDDGGDMPPLSCLVSEGIDTDTWRDDGGDMLPLSCLVSEGMDTQRHGEMMAATCYR